MNSLQIYTDKSENFKFQLTLEGADISNTFSRLCLEFDDGQNIYFKGKLDNTGLCTVKIPAMKGFQGSGNAKIEVVAESTYFPIHEMRFNIEKKLEVTCENIRIEETETPISKPKINIIFEDKNEIDEDDEINEEDEIEDEPKYFSKGNKKFRKFL